MGVSSADGVATARDAQWGKGDRALILRLFHGTARASRSEDLAAELAGPLLVTARSMPGLISYASGVRLDGDVTRLILVTTWSQVDDVLRLTGGRLDLPAGPLPDFVTPGPTEHLELVSEPAAVIVPSSEGVVRVARMAVTLGREEEFYAIVRRRLGELRMTGDLIAYHLGRKVGERHEAVAVSVWRSVDALGQVVPPTSGAPFWQEELEPVLDSFDVEHFDAIGVPPG